MGLRLTRFGGVRDSRARPLTAMLRRSLLSP
jgi:hypothetical protein